MTGEKHDECELISKGIRSGIVIRPEPLFHRRTRLIIDTHYNSEHNILRNGLEEIEFDHIKLISIEKLFNSTNEVFLGFGLPNVYLTIPNEEHDGYVKFAAFMLWRQRSAIVPTKGRVQSGFLIRLRDISKETTEILRRSMETHKNSRNVSCAYANASVLTTAGFTSGGTSLANHFGARALFQQIYEHGLEFQGEPVVLDFIRTTCLTLEEHFHQVRLKELTSLGRIATKVYNECTSSDEKSRAPIIPVTDIPINPVIQSDVKSLLRLQISRPARFGAIVRKVWGSHTLFKVIPNRELTNMDKYLPDTLLAFPLKNPDLFTRIKKTFLFSRLVVMFIRNRLVSMWDDHGEFQIKSLATMMSIHTEKEPHPYNIVITGDYLIGMHYNPLLDMKMVNWVLSKHVLISGYDDDVRFAGEAWMEHQQNGLTLHLTNNSGTYRPNEQQLENAKAFLTEIFPGLNVEIHVGLDPIASSQIQSKKEKHFLTLKNIFIIFIIFLFVFLFFWLF